jgi:hypothetical protein
LKVLGEIERQSDPPRNHPRYGLVGVDASLWTPMPKTREERREERLHEPSGAEPGIIDKVGSEGIDQKALLRCAAARAGSPSSLLRPPPRTA